MTKELLVEMRSVILEEFEERENPDVRNYILSLDAATAPTIEGASSDGTSGNGEAASNGTNAAHNGETPLAAEASAEAIS